MKAIGQHAPTPIFTRKKERTTNNPPEPPPSPNAREMAQGRQDCNRHISSGHGTLFQSCLATLLRRVLPIR